MSGWERRAIDPRGAGGGFGGWKAGFGRNSKRSGSLDDRAAADAEMAGDGRPGCAKHPHLQDGLVG
jgi:hypothetical protein